MAEDPLHDIIESIRSRLRTELETQIQAVSERHEQALEEQRNRIEAEAEQLWAPQLQAARAEVEHQAAAAAAARATLDDLQQLLDKERSLSEARREEGPASTGLPIAPLHPSWLVDRLRTIDAANSVAASLSAIARAASSDASRAALYLANGTRLEQMQIDDHAAPGASSHDLNDPGDSIAVEAFRRGEPVGRNGSAYAVPVVLDGTPVGVLYGEADPLAAPAGWAESLETLARYGAARLGYLTALRTAQARQWLAESPTGAAASAHTGSQSDETTASARRYARLVVSEIKLYNEGAVEEGRSRRDLLARLGPEIDRARRLYEERVPVSVPGRSEHFQQELIQTLAGGDPSLLG